jgi:transcriptional regulator with XRE-family HTH domain
MASALINGRSRAVQLGAELRDARKRCAMTVAGVAEALGYHHSTVSRWERGESMPSEADTGAFLALLGTTGEERERLIELARHDDVIDWVAPGIGKQLAALIEYEKTARTIIEVNPLLIPGLLQTREYARSIMIGGGVARGKAEQGAIIRTGRQDVLTRRKPVNYVGVVGEQAVRYPACTDEVMVEQFHHLLSMAKRPNVRIHVLPLEPRYSLAFEGRFVLLEPDYGNPVVQVESYWSTSMLTSERAVRSYQEAASAICRDALSPDETVKLIEELVRGMGSRA